MTTTEKMRHYVSVNFLCDTDGEEPTQEQLNEAFRAMLKEEQGTIEFEVWDGRWLDEREDEA
jgi:Ca2+-binding EF-hand superfamily protein